jgi:hypothetical protein
MGKPEAWRKGLTDPESFEPFLRAARTAIWRDDDGSEVADTGWEMCVQVGLAALHHVHKRAESPIEQLFMGSAVMALWAHWPLGPLVPWPALFDPALSDHADKEVRTFAEVMYGGFNSGHRPHFICQYKPADDQGVLPGATEEAIRELGNIRLDALFFIPADLTKRVVVECDGYEWHKDNFTEDRQRDRKLQRAGFDVVRFSGREINADPLGCGRQLFDHLHDRWGSAAVGLEPFPDEDNGEDAENPNDQA